MSKKGINLLDGNLWKRQFSRGSEPGTTNPLPDIDTVANDDFQKENFVDHFGTLLRTDPAFRKHNSYNDLCSSFFDSENLILQTYVVADGQTVPKEKQKPWFRSELRFISLVLPVDANHPKKSVAPVSSVSWAPWFWLIASSSAVHSTKDILHVMSWSADDGQFRYYARDLLNNNLDGTRGWVYLCSSEDAFNPSTAYLGPLNGHVNGGLVMKEIHKPWLHWLVNGRGVFELIPDDLYKVLAGTDWLTTPGFPPLYGASVQSAENLERIVLDSLREWFVRRKQRDFFNKDGTAKDAPLNIQRWAAHFFLTTNVNIIAAPNSQPLIPYDFFFNYEMLRCYSDLLPNQIQQTKAWQDAHPCSDATQDKLKDLGISSPLKWSQQYKISPASYDVRSYLHIARKFKLCTLQEVPPKTPESVYMGADKLSGGIFMGTLGDGNEDIDGRKAVYFAVTQWGEGDNPWVILQPSVEDAMGVWTSQKMFQGKDKNGARTRIFSDATFNALMMVDFWNPIFSWRRLRLMQYIPLKTSLSGPTRDPALGEDVYTYSLEKEFIEAVEKSPDREKKDSPEAQFLDNLKMSIFDHQIRISAYMGMVNNNCASSEHIESYLRLAESRRRMFRPLPMNFFGSNLPYCLGIEPSTPWLEMTSDGTVQPIPDVGLGYLQQWLGSLAGFDPNVLPLPASSTEPESAGVLFTPLDFLDSGVPEIPSAEERKDRVTNQHKPALPIVALPKPSTMRMACQASIIMTNPREETVKGGCPFIIRKTYDSGESFASVSTFNAPTWTDNIKQLFTEPSWPTSRKPKDVGDDWIGSMKYYGPLSLDSYQDVKSQVITIYQHLRSRSMPITSFEDEHWPDWALELLRNWANTGGRENSTDPIVEKAIIPLTEHKYRVRKDVMDLTDDEVTEYRMKLDDVLGALRKDSKWQELGWLHAQWCLHYQEATFFWHRAMLLWVENLIDFPIPYWNGLAKEAANPTSKFAGLPKIFLEDKYYHPKAKEWRPNPLRHALNSEPTSIPLKRDPILEKGQPSLDDPEWNFWERKIKHYMPIYHKQIKDSLAAATFSHPEGTGFPWANIPAFRQDMKNSEYKYRETFDGLFEQPHDNFHGWLGGIGGDMSDNTKTGFDPIFYSLHCNLDRVFSSWLRQHPNDSYTTNFPLRPFVDMAKGLSYDDPRQYIYTTIGDMGKDTRALNYLYAPPASPDAVDLKLRAYGSKPSSQGGHALIMPPKETLTASERIKQPWIVFEDVRCTTRSYRINVFLREELIAQSTRLGMGLGDLNNGGLRNRKRCDKETVNRAIKVDHWESELRERSDVRLEVEDLGVGRMVTEEAREWQGFQAKVVWV